MENRAEKLSEKRELYGKVAQAYTDGMSYKRIMEVFKVKKGFIQYAVAKQGITPQRYKYGARSKYGKEEGEDRVWSEPMLANFKKNSEINKAHAKRKNQSRIEKENKFESFGVIENNPTCVDDKGYQERYLEGDFDY